MFDREIEKKFKEVWDKLKELENFLNKETEEEITNEAEDKQNSNRETLIIGKEVKND